MQRNQINPVWAQVLRRPRWEQVALAVIVAPQIAHDTLYHQLQGKIPQLHRVGDCVAPRRVEHAILDGERAARAL